MLNLTAAQLAYFRTARQRRYSIAMEIYDRMTGSLVTTISGTTNADERPRRPKFLPGWSVRYDPSSDVLATGSFAIVDPNHDLDMGVNGLIGLDHRYRVYKPYWIGGTWVPFPLGEFELSGEPRMVPETGMRTIQFQLADKSSNGGRPRGGFKDPLVIQTGATKLAAIQAIAGIDTWGETKYNLWQGSTATVYKDWPIDKAEQPWAAIQRINELVEPDGTITRLYYDRYGRLTLAPDPGPNLDQLPPVWEVRVAPGRVSQLIHAQKSLDPFKLTNMVEVSYGSEMVVPGRIWSEDTDPNSPTYVQKIGPLIYRWKDGAQDELIKNDEEALARAVFERQRKRSEEESVEFEIIENPALEPWDVIRLYEPEADIDGNYQLLSFTIGDGIAMQCRGWKVRKIA